MIKGKHVLLRPIRDEDWTTIEGWAQEKDAFWGAYQRFQLDHVPMLRQIYQQTGLLKRESGILLVETIQDQERIGFVRYSMIPFPDADLPYPEIGFGIARPDARGKGYAREAVSLLVDYLFAGYPVERIAAFTDRDNLPAQRMMESVGFQPEGTLRRAMFRDGQWRDVLIYAILRAEAGN